MSFVWLLLWMVVVCSADIAGNGVTTASTDPAALDPSFLPSKAIDNSFGSTSYFRTKAGYNGTAYLELDFKAEFTILSVGINYRFQYTGRDVTVYLYNAQRMQIYNSPVMNPTNNCQDLGFFSVDIPAGFPKARFMRIERAPDLSFGFNCTCGCAKPTGEDFSRGLFIWEVNVFAPANQTNPICQPLNVTLDPTFYNGTFNEESFLTPESIAEGWIFNRSSFSSNVVGCSDVPVKSRAVFARYQGVIEKICTGLVNVKENVPPVAQCMDADFFLTNSNLVATLSPATFNNASFDACTSVSVEVSQEVFSCPDRPGQMVTLKVKDLSGNEASCNAMLTLNDTTVMQNTSFTAPAAIAQGGSITICNSFFNPAGLANGANGTFWRQVGGVVGATISSTSATTRFPSIQNIPLGLSQFRYTTLGDGCISSSADISVNRVERFDNLTNGVVGFPASTEAQRGLVYVGCRTQIQMYATSPSFGSGSWSVSGFWGGFAQTNNFSDPNTLVNITGPEPFIMRWSVSDSNCFRTAFVETLVVPAVLDKATIITPNTVLPCGNTRYEVEGFLQVYTNFSGCSPSKRSPTAPPGQLYEREPTGCKRELGSSSFLPPALNVVWSIFSQPFGGNAQILNPTSPKTNVTNLAVGDTVLQYTLSGPNCVSKSTTVTLTRPDSVSRANAGPDQDIGCRTSTFLHATAFADVNVGGEPEFNPMGNIGKWSIVTSPTTTTTSTTAAQTTTVMTTTANPNATTGVSMPFTTTPAGTTTAPATTPAPPSFNEFQTNTPLTNINGPVTMRWTITSPDCPALSSFDDVTIKQYAAVSAANAGGSKVVNCARAVKLDATPPAFGIGRWSILSGRGKLGNVLDPKTVLTSINGTVVLAWNVTGSGCAVNTSDVISVTRTEVNCTGCLEVALGDDNIINSCDPPAPLFLTKDVTFTFAVTFTEFESDNATIAFSGDSFVVSGKMMLKNSKFTIGTGKNVTLGALAVDSGSTLDVASGAELTIGGDVTAGNNVSFSFVGANVKVSGSFTLSSTSSLNVDSDGSSGGISANRMIFAGRLLLKVLQLVLTQEQREAALQQQQLRDNVVSASTVTNPASTPSPNGVILSSNVPVASYQSADGSFTSAVLDYSNRCDTVLSSTPVRGSSTLSVVVSVSRDTSLSGCDVATTSTTGDAGLPVGAIIGIVIGSLVVVVLFAVFIIWYRKREVAKANARFLQSQSSKRSSAYQNSERE